MPSVVDDNAGNEENAATEPSERKDDDDNGSERNDNSDGAGMNEENVGQEETRIESKGSDTNVGTDSSEQEDKNDNGSEEDHNSDGAGVNEEDSSEQGEKDIAGNEDNLSSASFGEVLHPPLTETGHVDGLMVSASKKRKKKEKKVEDRDKNSESGDKDSPEEETNTVESEKSPPITVTDHKDGLLVSKKRKRTKKTNAKDGPMPSSEKRGTANQALAAIQSAALQNHNRMNQVMMLNPQMMIQQRLLHNNLMLQAAQVAKASMVMATPHCVASNNTMGAYNSRCRLVTKLGMGGHNCRLVTLELPVGQKLGMVLDNNAASGMPELKRLTPDSPIRHQIPMEFQQGCCIGYLKSDVIGHVQPTTAQECVELITKSKAGRLTSVKMEMLLVQTKMGIAQLPIPLVNLPNNRLSSGNSSEPSLKVPPKKPNTHSPYKDWRKPYKTLVDYKKQHGNCNVPPSHNPQLAHWIWEQRQKKKQKKLNACRLDRLNEIGFDWTGGYNLSYPTQRSTAVDGAFSKQSIAAQSTPEWEARYEALVRFKNRCGFFPASGDLHEWIERQKEAVGCIPQGRVRKLVEIGLDLPSESLEKLKEAGANFEEWFGDDVVEEEGGTEGSAKSTGGNQKQSKKQKISQGNTNTREKNPILFWQSAEAAKLFGFHRGGPRGDDNVLKGLEDRIQLLKKANESVNGWKRLIPNDGKEEQYSHHDIMVVRHKAQYLIKAYLLAMKKMNKETWGQCCVMAATELNELGLTKFSGGEGVARWNTQFRIVHTFPHPKRHVTKKQSCEFIRIFEYFPSAKDMFLVIANENMDRLTGKLMKEEFATTILPALEMESRENGSFDDGSPEQKMLVKLLANAPSGALVLKWMRHFNIEWDKQCTRKGRDGGSFLSKRMSEAWAAGKYENRRPKGKGLKKGKQSGDEDQEDNDEDQIPDEDDIADWETHS